MWKKSDSIIGRTITQKGLSGIVSSGQVCTEAERLYPDLFRAVSLRNGVLHLETKRANALSIKSLERELIASLNRFSTPRSLPQVTRVRLTFQEETATI